MHRVMARRRGAPGEASGEAWSASDRCMAGGQGMPGQASGNARTGPPGIPGHASGEARPGHTGRPGRGSIDARPGVDRCPARGRSMPGQGSIDARPGVDRCLARPWSTPEKGHAQTFNQTARHAKHAKSHVLWRVIRYVRLGAARKGACGTSTEVGSPPSVLGLRPRHPRSRMTAQVATQGYAACGRGGGPPR